MAKKKKPSTKLPTQLETWKSIRKDPVPAKRVHLSKDRDLTDKADEAEAEYWRNWRGEDPEEYEDE